MRRRETRGTGRSSDGADSAQQSIVDREVAETGERQRVAADREGNVRVAAEILRVATEEARVAAAEQRQIGDELRTTLAAYKAEGRAP